MSDAVPVEGKVLTRGIAEQIREGARGAVCDEFTSLEKGAAKILAKCDSWGLSLNGVATLSDSQAEALAKHKGSLELNGLTSLSDSCAEALAKHLHYLSLDGLTSLSDSCAEALAKHEAPLRLNGLTALSDSCAEALAKHKGPLRLNGLTSLFDSCAEALARHEGSLELNGLTALADSCATALAKHEDYLSLDGLTSLADSCAEALAKHEAPLRLNGLTSWESRSLAKRLFDGNDPCLPGKVAMISAGVAQFLAEHDGELDLNGLQVICQDVATALSLHKGVLLLNGLSEITAEVGRGLAKHQGTLGLLGLTKLSGEVADELWMLSPGGVNARPEIQKQLADKRSHGLTWLNELPSLTDAALVRLAHFRGDLRLDGLQSLSDQEAQLLVNRGELLSLNGLSTVPHGVAAVLAEHAGQLSLDGVTALSDEAAVTLATHVGDLDTSGWPESAVQAYQSTREAVSRELRYATNPASVNLSRVKHLSAQQSRVLARTGWYLNLSGIASLSDEAASMLANHAGSINLMNLRDLSEEGGRALACHQGPIFLALDRLPNRVAAAFRETRWVNSFSPAGAFTNSIGMTFVKISAGEFRMGTLGNTGEECPHRVRITRPYFLGMHLVTQSQYERVTGVNPSFFRGPELPVEHLAWKDARAFCEALSLIPEERLAGRSYRLPTEAEWEYACRAGTTTQFNIGDWLEQDEARFCEAQKWQPQQTVPVGSYAPNAWGLFDMHGNVWEWTQDWFASDYYERSPVEDPRGPDDGTHHTLRGGSASVTADECRSAIRGEASVDGPAEQSQKRFEKIGDFGLRVVCETTDPAFMPK